MCFVINPLHSNGVVMLTKNDMRNVDDTLGKADYSRYEKGREQSKFMKDFVIAVASILYSHILITQGEWKVNTHSLLLFDGSFVIFSLSF